MVARDGGEMVDKNGESVDRVNATAGAEARDDWTLDGGFADDEVGNREATVVTGVTTLIL